MKRRDFTVAAAGLLGLGLSNLQAQEEEKFDLNDFFESNINWTWVSQIPNLPIEAIRKYKHKLDWDVLSKKLHKEEELREFKDFLNWEFVYIDGWFQNPSDDFKYEFRNYINWSENSINASENLIRRIPDYINWDEVSRGAKFRSEEFLLEFKSRLFKFRKIVSIRNRSPEFIDEFIDDIDWSFVSLSGLLNIHQLRKYSNKVDWYGISKSHELTEEEILEFKYQIHWKQIAKHQKLSDAFVEKYKDLLNGKMTIYQFEEYEKFMLCRQDTANDVIVFGPVPNFHNGDCFGPFPNKLVFGPPPIPNIVTFSDANKLICDLKDKIT